MVGRDVLRTVFVMCLSVPVGIRVADFDRHRSLPLWLVNKYGVASCSLECCLAMPRHIGLYSGVPLEVPAVQVQRVCGTGIECILQAADAIALRRTDLALVVGTESMTRNPIAA